MHIECMILKSLDCEQACTSCYSCTGIINIYHNVQIKQFALSVVPCLFSLKWLVTDLQIWIFALISFHSVPLASFMINGVMHYCIKGNIRPVLFLLPLPTLSAGEFKTGPIPMSVIINWSTTASGRLYAKLYANVEGWKLHENNPNYIKL